MKKYLDYDESVMNLERADEIVMNLERANHKKDHLWLRVLYNTKVDHD